MKHLILLSLLTFTSIFANAEVCGNTNPRLCVGDIVYTQKGVDGWANTYKALITAVSADQKTYSVNLADFSDSYSGKSIAGLGVTTEKKCSATNPRICIGDTVYTVKNRDGWANTYRAQVVALSSNYTKFTLQFLDYSDKHSDKSLHGLAITGSNRCGKSNPKLCVGDEVVTRKNVDGWGNNYNAKIIGIGSDLISYVVKLNDYYDILSGKIIDGLAITKRINAGGIDSLSVHMSTDTQDIVQTYQALASVTTNERSDFLLSSSAYLTQLNSEDVNIMAGMVVAKIVRLSTSQAVKENFEKSALEFTAAIEKNNWKSIEQIEANSRTLDFATRVIYAAVKLKLSLADSSHQNNADLAELGRIAATTQLSKKLSGLQAFCESHRSLVDELIQDPRHGVLGMTTADIMGWVMSK